MNCNYCDNTATVFLTQVLENELKKICICEECAADKEIMEKEGLGQFLGDDLIPHDAPQEQDTQQQDLPVDDLPDITCECGFSLADLSATGRLGCSHCYETFAVILGDRISSLHRGSLHRGKELVRPVTPEYLKKTILQTQNALEVAVDKEDFEQAAKLRDQLDQQKAELNAL